MRDISSKYDLTQDEALALLKMKKICTNEPKECRDSSFSLNLESADKKEKFTIDCSKGRISMKYSNNLRCRAIIPLLRLDVGGGYHNNPKVDIACLPGDPFYEVHYQCVGMEFSPGEPHIHYYREGFNDRWAYPLPDCFTDPSNRDKTFYEFLLKCNVDGKPTLQGGLYDCRR